VKISTTAVESDRKAGERKMAVLGSLLFIVCAISVFYPLRFMMIPNRLVAMCGVVLSIALVGGMAPTPTAKTAQSAVQPLIVVSDGCDLAGAIPNCKAVTADLAAKGVQGTGRSMTAPKAAEHASGLDKPIMSDAEWANFRKQVQQGQDRSDDANKALELSRRAVKDAEARAEGRPIDWGGRGLR
jgi:hypothetical protein